MKELVEFLAKNIVSQPKEVCVEETKEPSGDTLKLSVASNDMGKIIGKMGRVIKALRTLVKIKAIKEGRRVYLELVEQNLDRDQAPETSNQ
jgi:predicted RNA-binding protein YlqC (UPF0109 family)